MRPLQDEVEPPVLKLASSMVKLESTQAFSYITEFFLAFVLEPHQEIIRKAGSPKVVC